MLALNPQVEIGADWWNERYREGAAQGWTIWKDRRLLEHVVNELPSSGLALVLASGGGVGVATIAEKRPDLHFNLVDYSEEALGVAWKTFGNRVGRFRWDLQSIPWPFEVHDYDSVICSELLEHVKDPGAILAECRRVLRPGGSLIATFPIHRDLLSPHHRWLFEPADPWRMLDRCKLKVHHLRESKLLLAIAIV